MSDVLSGGLILDGSDEGRALASPLPFTETWTLGADGPGLNGDKSWTMGATGWAVSSHQALLTNNGLTSSRGQCNVNTGTDDVQVTITLTTYTPDITGTLAAGPCVRMQGDVSLNFYTAVIVTNGGTSSAVIYRFQGGVQTQIGPSVPVSPHAGMTVGLRAVGPKVRMYVDGLPIITTTDAGGLATGRFAGLQGVASGANLVRVDNVLVETAPVITAAVPLELLSLSPMNALVGVH